jgi:hypothetical protein
MPLEVSAPFDGVVIQAVVEFLRLASQSIPHDLSVVFLDKLLNGLLSFKGVKAVDSAVAVSGDPERIMREYAAISSPAQGQRRSLGGEPRGTTDNRWEWAVVSCQKRI